MKTKIFIASILIILLFFCSLSILKKEQGAWIVIVYGSPADAYGNDICYVEVWQYNGTAWNLACNFTSSGGSCRIDSFITKFIVMVKLNETLASSQSQALELTKNYMNITYDSTYVWSNQELNNTSCTGPTSGFYWIKEWGNWTTNLPQEGITYTCKLDYQQKY